MVAYTEIKKRSQRKLSHWIWNANESRPYHMRCDNVIDLKVVKNFLGWYDFDV